jgi:hypothetical protein
MSDYLNLKGFDSVFSTTLNNELQDNIVEFMDWALLQKGNYQNVHLNELSPQGFDYSRLKVSSVTPSGSVWEGFRQNWVWQSGVNYNPPPVVGNNNAIPGISGVYVNNTFYPSSSSGTYAHKVDYYHGRILFNNPIPTGSKVQAEHSYKYINVIYANSLPWLREIQYRSLSPDPNSTEFSIPSESKVQLPAIAIEIVPRRTLRGYQLGGGQYVDTDVLFHCLAEDEFTRNKLVDIVSLQNDKTVHMFNSNSVANSGDFPLDYRGIPVSGALRYPDLVSTHYRGKMRFKNSLVQSMDLINSNFYAGIVRFTVETIELTI